MPSMQNIEEFVLIHQAFARECVNGASMVICGCLTATIAIHLFQAFWFNNSNERWDHQVGVPVACALIWVFAAECYRTGAIWHVYRFSPSHDASSLGSFADVAFWPTLGYIVAGIVLDMGLLRCIYIFTPPVAGRIAWKLAAGLSIAFLILSQLI